MTCFYCSIAEKIAENAAPPVAALGAKGGPRSFRYRQNHTTITRSHPHLGRPHYDIERFNWRTVGGFCHDLCHSLLLLGEPGVFRKTYLFKVFEAPTDSSCRAIEPV